MYPVIQARAFLEFYDKVCYNHQSVALDVRIGLTQGH